MICPSETIVKFRDGLANIVKLKNIVDDSNVIEGYSKDRSFVIKDNPLLLVYPETKEEIHFIQRTSDFFTFAVRQ